MRFCAEYFVELLFVNYETVWKAEGMKINNKVVVSLTDREKEHGLTHVALSRVTTFSNLGIKDERHVCILRWKND